MYSLEDLEPIVQIRREHSILYADVYNLLLNSSKVGGVLLFGLSFFILSKQISNERLKSSIMLIGVGLILLYGINISSLIIVSLYPPWGIISISYFLAGSYCLMIGLESAAFYIATDSSLRRMLRDSPDRFIEIVKSLGDAKMNEIVIRKVNGISKSVYDNIERENLFRASLEESNIHDYIIQVLEEVQRKDDKILSSRDKGDKNNESKDVP
jgi:hypothetical protein